MPTGQKETIVTLTADKEPKTHYWDQDGGQSQNEQLYH